MYNVVAYSYDVKKIFLSGVSLEDAQWFYNHHNGWYPDTNGFEWALEIERG